MKKATFLVIACMIFEIAYAQPDSAATSKLRIDIHGFILMNGVYDLNGLENYDDFTTSEIPIDPTPGEKMDRLYLSVRQSRIGLAAFYPSSLGLIKGIIKADFYSDAQHAHSFFRLRDAYIQMNHFLIGKSLTTFGDSEVLPNTIDFEGPNSASGNRNTMIKYFNNINAKYKYTLAIEAPGSDIIGFTNVA